jgi:hypothetical protein
MQAAGAEAEADEEELEPLFDYSRVQPTMAFSFDGTRRCGGGCGHRIASVLSG